MTEFWIWLNTPPSLDRVLGPFVVIYALVFTAGLVVSAYLNAPAAAPLAANPIQRAGVAHWSQVGLWIFGPGLFFLGVRLLQINPLSMGEPIWLVCSVIAAVIAGVRCIQWWRTTYPQLLSAELTVHNPSPIDGARQEWWERDWAGGQLGTTAANRYGHTDPRLPASDS